MVSPHEARSTRWGGVLIALVAAGMRVADMDLE